MKHLKKLLFVIILLLLARTTLYGQPFLVSAPVAKTDPSMPITNYCVSGLAGTLTVVPATINADGSAQLHLDLGKFSTSGGPLTNGSYTVNCYAQNAKGNGALSAPFTFTFQFPTTLPGIPGSISLSPN